MKILSWNIANYDDHPHWEVRKKLIVTEILRTEPNVIALQEVRFNSEHPSTKEYHLNSAEQILCDLQSQGRYLNSQILTQPAMYYKSPTFWEGLSIIADCDIIETGSIFHSLLQNTSDSNKRITQYTVCKSKDFAFSLLNTHFSYDSQNIQTNVIETVDFLKRFQSHPCLLFGDMNAEIQELRKLSLSGMTDVWSKLKSDKLGLSYPSSNPVKRIDYCWANEQAANKIKNIEQVGTTPDKGGIFASDHFGTLVTLKI